MNEEKLKGQWEQLKGEIKKQWGKLTDDEIESAKGNLQNLIGLIIARYGIMKEDAENKLNALVEGAQQASQGIKEEIKENWGSFKKEATEKAGEVKEGVEHASQSFLHYIKDHPLSTMGMSFVVGMFLGMIRK